MKKHFIFLFVSLFMAGGVFSSCGEDELSDPKPFIPNKPNPDPDGGGSGGSEEEENDGFVKVAFMTPDKTLVGKDWKAIDGFMQSMGWNYTEHPNNFAADHTAETHIDVVKDADLDKYAFILYAHANAKALDYERGVMKDRQRNELKTNAERAEYNKYNGNLHEWQKLEWKFKLPADFKPTKDFCHIHQLKMAEAASNTKFPIITFTPRSDAGGGNERLQVIHYGDDDKMNVLVDREVPLSEVKGEWIQVQCKAHYETQGSYSVKLTRIRDKKVLLDKTFSVDMWRTNGQNVRSKFGIYRSFGSTMNSTSDRPTNGIKDESILFTDFVLYEK